jgi:putative ABC transport system permease protein
MAVGAKPAGILRMILRESLTIAAAGSIAGCLAAVFAGRWLASLLFGTQPSDPLVLGGAALAMLVIAAVATIRPARAASTADPAALLKVQ